MYNAVQFYFKHVLKKKLEKLKIRINKNKIQTVVEEEEFQKMLGKRSAKN